MIAFILENWDSGNCDDFSGTLSQHLIETKELNLFKRLWKGIIRNRLEKLWYDVDYQRKNYPNITLNKIINTSVKNYNQFSSNESLERTLAWRRLYIIEGINEFISGLEILNDKYEIEKQSILLSIVSNLDKPKPKPSTDKRKIDEVLFWDLIQESRSVSQDQFEFLEKLKEKLETFQPTEIRKFQKIFLEKFNQLDSWDLWALAYIVRKGCGDDVFDYFKAWVISKGKDSFNDIMTLNLKHITELFNEDPQLEDFLYLAENVYESKTNDIMKPVSVKTQKMKGKEWKEEDLEATYPELSKLFDYSNNSR